MKALTLTILFISLIQVKTALAQNSVNLVPDAALASIAKGHAIINQLHAQAAEACQQNRQINEGEVIKQVDQFNLEMEAAQSLLIASSKEAGTYSRLDPRGPGCFPDKEVFMLVTKLKLGQPKLYQVKILIDAWKRSGFSLNLSACEVASRTEKEAQYAAYALKAAIQYRSGDETPVCYEL